MTEHHVISTYDEATDIHTYTCHTCGWTATQAPDAELNMHFKIVNHGDGTIHNPTMSMPDGVPPEVLGLDNMQAQAGEETLRDVWGEWEPEDGWGG